MAFHDTNNTGIAFSTDGPGLYDKEIQQQTLAPEQKIGKCHRFDRKMWSSGPLHVQEKARNHLRANTLVSDKTLFIVRLCILLLITLSFIERSRFWHLPKDYKYFTNWGFTMTEFYFIIVVLAYAVDRFGSKAQDSNHFGNCKMWKWVTYLFQTAITWEVIITIVYWGLLWPTETHVAHGWLYDFKRTILVHLLPLIFLSIDFALNRIYFEWHQVWI